MKEFFVQTKKQVEAIDITHEIEARIEKNAKACLVFVPHATAAIILNEYEPNIKSDYEKFYSELAKGDWRHNSIDNNAEAHLLSSLVKPFALIPCENGKLLLGTWQRVMLLELDGPRRRKITLTTL
ncbi:MAG: secondary thiamine-phosphate synthase enzyme YjbQ [Candidatus Anstonellales archaeon]